jgi:transcriptional regulator with XRE-family HTH domain
MLKERRVIMKNTTLRELRESKKISPQTASEALEISKTYLWYLETGQRNPSDKLKMKMANLYKVSPTTIFLASQTTKR